jgi:hypothetical protein
MSEQTKTIRIPVPADYVLPAFYAEATAAERAMALTFGAETCTQMGRRARDEVLSKSHAEAKKELEEAFTARLEEERRGLTTKLAKAEEALRVARQRNEALEGEAAAVRAEAKKEARESAAELLAAKDEQIAHMREEKHRDREALATQVAALSTSLTKTANNSKKKGDVGEAIMEDLLKKAFDCVIEVVARQGHEADLMMLRPKGSYLWEVKNYSYPVPKTELTKFYKDLEAKPDLKGGVFVSLMSPITGHARGGDIDLEFLEDGRFVIFLSRFMDREDPVFALQNLRPLFEVVEARVATAGMSVDAAELEGRAGVVKSILETHEESLRIHYNVIQTHKRRSDAMFQEFEALVARHDTNTKAALRVLLGGKAVQDAFQNEATMELASAVFVPSCVGAIQVEKNKLFVKWLLNEVVVEEGAELKILDLVARAKTAGYSENFVRGVKESLFTADAWPKSSKTIRGLRFADSPRANVIDVDSLGR